MLKIVARSNKLDRRLSSSFLLQYPLEAMMKGPEQVRFQIQYLRAFPIAPLPSLRDRLQHALPNFCRQSHAFIRILVREFPARISLYPRPESARDSYQLVVMIERLRLIVWGITRKDPIWVQFRARHPGASHLLGFAGQTSRLPSNGKKCQGCRVLIVSEQMDQRGIADAQQDGARLLQSSSAEARHLWAITFL